MLVSLYFFFLEKQQKYCIFRCLNNCFLGIKTVCSVLFMYLTFSSVSIPRLDYSVADTRLLGKYNVAVDCFMLNGIFSFLTPTELTRDIEIS